MNPLLLAFYGDDFTGSADAMEALTINGVKTALFLGHPTEERLRARLADLQAVGISGTSRTMTPSQMDAELPDQLALLDSLNPGSCTTRSARHSIPRPRSAASDTPPTSPLTSSIPTAASSSRAPPLGRYIAFGNHFTVYGDQRYRLDRHRVISKHPTTPMGEGDLRVHLAPMTKKSIALIDLIHLEKSPQALSARFDRSIAEGADIVLFDTLNDKNLNDIGRLLVREMP